MKFLLKVDFESFREIGYEYEKVPYSSLKSCRKN